MVLRQDDKPEIDWSFDDAIKLLQSDKALPESPPKLGDFDLIWQYLRSTPDQNVAGVENDDPLTTSGDNLSTPPDKKIPSPRTKSVLKFQEVEIIGDSQNDSSRLRAYDSDASQLGNVPKWKKYVDRAQRRRMREASKGHTDNEVDLGKDVRISKTLGEESGKGSARAHRSPTLMSQNLRSSGYGGADLSSQEIRIVPPSGMTAVDQKLRTMQLLRQRFPEDANSLLSYSHYIPKKAIQDIHVFVDLSNIIHGYRDHLKLSNGFPLSAHVAIPHLDFQTLTLILERGRRRAKGIVVGSQSGSKDASQEERDAEACKYKCHILHQVKKVPHMTPRKLGFIRQEQELEKKETGYTSTSDAATRPKYVEQGVDEILSLSMNESLLDTAQPATLVLASGDAAEGEYSPGFMKVVERALMRKWKVEVLSFSKNLSFAYRSPKFVAKWGKQFKVLELDDFAAYLMHVS